MEIAPEILDILVCPSCKAKLIYDAEKKALLCNFEKIAYPIQDGIPIMLVDQAKPIVGS